MKCCLPACCCQLNSFCICSWVMVQRPSHLLTNTKLDVTVVLPCCTGMLLSDGGWMFGEGPTLVPYLVLCDVIHTKPHSNHHAHSFLCSWWHHQCSQCFHSFGLLNSTNVSLDSSGNIWSSCTSSVPQIINICFLVSGTSRNCHHPEKKSRKPLISPESLAFHKTYFPGHLFDDKNYKLNINPDVSPLTSVGSSNRNGAWQGMLIAFLLPVIHASLWVILFIISNHLQSWWY